MRPSKKRKEQSQRQSHPNQKRETELMIFAAEIGDQNLPTLDVHGYSVTQAIDAVDEFLNKEHAGAARTHQKTIRIITGHGTGKMQQAILRFLQQNPYNFIDDFRQGQLSAQAEASIYAILAPNRR